MGKYIGPKFKKSRRAGVKLMLRGKSSESPTSPFVKRSYPPGIHGPKGKPRQTQYGLQLMEKQKARWIYGLRERQFRSYFDTAFSSQGDTGELLIQALETRLDTIVYQLGLATTRAQARQMVNHWHIVVNGKRIDRPSYQVQVGDEIGVRDKSKSSPIFKENVEGIKVENIPSWLSVDKEKMSGKLLSNVAVNEMEPLFDVTSIVEYYSR